MELKLASQEIELEGTIKHQTEKAILFETGMGEAWLPKSQIESADDETSILIAEWFAIEKGLV